jgi:hypothetical protein
VEEEAKQVSPEQMMKTKETSSFVKQQSAQKRRVLTGTKTPGHPTSTDFN